MKKIIAIAGFLGLFASQVTTSSAAYFNTDPIIRCDKQITKTLKAGSQNGEVLLLQEMLVNAGFLNATPNGYFGYQTVAAVRSFQRHNSLSVTGKVDASTKDAVNERLCDVDLIDNTISSSDFYGYSEGVTYVAKNDPFVKVITPTNSNPTVYTTPQANVVRTAPSVEIVGNSATPFAPAPAKIAGVNIAYNPSTGYVYNIIPQSGSVTVTSPLVHSVFKEGDTVFVNWSTNNIDASSFTILLESSISSQSKAVGTISGNSYSFVLTKELLDAVCSGVCGTDSQDSFRVVVTTRTADLAGNISTLRAAVAPITIKRQLSVSRMTLTASNTSVASGEAFKLRVNLPTETYAGFKDAGYSIKVRALCSNSSFVTTSIAGTLCGQDFVIPFDPLYFQQELPVKITNTSLFRQDVAFEAVVIDSFGQVVGFASTKVTVSAAPFNW